HNEASCPSHPQADSHTRSGLSIRYFIEAMDDREIKLQLRRSKPVDMTQALKIALDEESYQELDKDSKVCSISDSENFFSELEKQKRIIESLEEQLAAFEKRYSEAPQSTPNAQGAGSVNFPDKMDNPLKLIETAPRSANSIQALNVLFVCARVGSQKLRFLVDTGSDVTVIRTCEINLSIGSCVYPHKVLVANIAEKAILGNDFLRQNRVVIDLSRNKLKIGTNTVQLYCDEGSFQCCKVTAARNFVIPPESEVVVEGLMHRRGSPFCEGVVESVSQLRQNHPQLMVAKTLVDCELSRKVPVRLLNVTSEPAIVQEGSRIGMLYPVQNEIHSVPSNETNASTNKDEVSDSFLDLINRTRGNVPTDKEQVVEDLLLKNKQVFVGPDEKLGRCNLYEHEIETGSALPIKQRAYRLPVHKREEVDKQVESMLEQGIVSPSLSPWASPIVLVEKKHDTHKSYRFCVDYRKLNKVTKVDAYPLPRIDDTIDVLSGSQYFSTLDLASGFWQMGLSEKAKEKTAFTTGYGLYHFNFDQPFILDTDSSDHSSGAILSQLHEGEEKVISYYSTTHSAPERKYSVTRKELLAVIKAIKHFRHYLYGREFVLRTDHASLRWLMGFKEPQGQIARWLEFLSSYQFTIEHRVGSKHLNADALSRIPVCSTITFDQFGWSKTDILKFQSEDPVLQIMIELLKKHHDRPHFNEISSDNKDVKSYWIQWEQLELSDDVLYRKWFDPATNETRKLLIVPPEMRNEILTLAHDSTT
ncbi:hypothetical protein ScPMuIL_007306, partial [Solemya velum]